VAASPVPLHKRIARAAHAGVRQWRYGEREVTNPGEPLDYATPHAPEPLGRWFLRRLIIFILILAMAVALIAALGRILDYYGVLIIPPQD
jgi:hypothetical protein